MIIDAILDRRAGCGYLYPEFEYIMKQARFFEFDYIVDAFCTKQNKAIQEALCKYIDEQNYNPDYKDYINQVDWTPNGFTVEGGVK